MSEPVVDPELPTESKAATDGDAPAEENALPPSAIEIDRVELAIDYAIIEHFSKHLYGSPNKAVEELVANSFDAFAYNAYVYIPGGGQVADRIVVWDDGESMDVEALKKLWWIARSPKNDGTDRERTKEEGRTRHLIGKFGIGKLASYAIGRRITHLCKKDGRYLVVRVDYGEIEEEMSDKEPGAATYTSSIFELSEGEATKWIESLFIGDAQAQKQTAGKNPFTIAVVDQLRDEIQLTQGRLRWVLGNGMPLRPDFAVLVNDNKVEPSLGKDATTTWDLSESKLVQSIQNGWNEAKAAKPTPLVEGEIATSEKPDISPTGDKRPVLVFPELGRVSADVMLFEKSLHREGESRDERSYGFFVMVRDRLLNVEDAELFLSPPSYGTFYRAQFVIRADRLDADLLADRERLVQNPRSRELAVIQQGLYRAARAEIERQDDERAAQEKFENLLPVSSRSLFRDPVVALLLRDREDGDVPDFDFSDPKVVREDLGVDDPVVVLDSDGFQVNAAHPFIKTLRDQLGSSKAALRAMRAIETLAISERLLEGYLMFELGLSSEQAAKVAAWREDLLRSLAVRYSSSADEIKAEVRNASYKGSVRFENALAALFSRMGYVAERRGASGDEDVLVIGPTGENETRFIVEGKGSKNKVANDAAELASAKSHAVNAKASVAIVVAREFVGFDQKADPAVLQEARAVSDKDPEGVTVVPVDVESLLALYDAVDKYTYPLEAILPVLAVIENPTEKMARIGKLETPIEHFDSKQLLDLIWQQQQGSAAGDWVPYRSVWQNHYKDGLSFEDFQIKLAALDTLAGGLITLHTSRELVVLRQSPEKIAEHLQRAVG